MNDSISLSFSFSLLGGRLRRLACVLLFAAGAVALAADATAPRDAELRAAVAALRQGAGNESARNSATATLEQLSRRFPADPFVSVQLANAYGVQARFANTRDAKSVWAAKANNVLEEVIAANPRYLLAQATRGVQMVMAPPVLGLESRGEQQLTQVIATTPSPQSDDDEAVITAYLFLARLYDRQADGLSGDAQTAKRRDAERMRVDLKKRYPRFDMARANGAN